MNGTSLWQRHDCHFQSLAHRFEIISQITSRCSRKMCNRFLIEWSSIKGFIQLTFFFPLERHPLKFYLCIIGEIFTKHEFSQILMCVRIASIFLGIKPSMCSVLRNATKIFHSGAKDFFIDFFLPSFVSNAADNLT